jgi:hypothetical protein
VRSMGPSFGYGLKAITHFAFCGWPRLISLLGPFELDVDKTSGGQPYKHNRKRQEISQ